MSRQQRLARVASKEVARAESYLDRLYREVLDKPSPVCFNGAMSNSTYRINSRTSLGTTDVITISENSGERDRNWTIVATADGLDVLVTPNGDHVDPNSLRPNQIAARRLVDWIMNNV